MTRWTWLWLAVVVVAQALAAAAFGFVCDDAWISFRYARHLAEGHGLTFSVGEPPVEGFSNLWWVLLAAACERVGLSPAIGTVGVSVGCAAALTLLQAHAARAMGLGAAGTFVSVVVLAASPGVVIWSTGGLETMAATLALSAMVAGWVITLRPWLGFVAAAALIGLRTEGVGWVGVVGAMGLWVGGRRNGPALTAAALVWLGLAAWRMQVFGGVVSNTAVAKVAFDPDRVARGARYVLGFWAASLAPGLALLTSPAALGRGRPWLCVAALAWGPPAFATLVGGDFMTMGRLLVPGIPMAALCVGLAVERAGRWRPVAAVAGVGLAALGTLVLFDVHPVPAQVRRALDVRENTSTYRTEVGQWRFMRGNARRWAQLGQALHQVERPGESIVLGAVGAVGYFCDLKVFDRYGLVSPEVAHRPTASIKGHSPGHDKEVPVTFFLPERPTYLHADLVRGHKELGDLKRQTLDWSDSPEVRAGWGPARYHLTLGGDPHTLVVLRAMDDPAPAWRALNGAAPEPR